MDRQLEFLTTIDEDYLIGLTNKGIVKRAAKDLEKQEPVIQSEGEEIILQIEDVVCTIRSPLGESTCTCPQRTICKHIILSTLYLKQKLALQSKKEEKSEEEQEETKEEQKETKQESEEKREWKQLKAFSIEKIRKTLGDKRFAIALARQKTNRFPTIKQSSIVLVSFETEDITVKLLEPVEYSTCSCHKKELCVHKAEALLCFQIQEGIINPSEFEQETGAEIDFEKLHQIGKEFLDFLQERIAIGLARSSVSVIDSLERYAIVAHNADLPEFERQFRALSEEYGYYFRRIVSFSGEKLLQRLTRVSKMAEKLCKVTTSEELLDIVGEFKSSYHEIGNLTLVGMGCRTFQSSSGFMGTVVYLFDSKHQQWYTYSSVRPTYYDNSRNFYSVTGREIAPWGLTCTLDELSEQEVILRNPRVNKDYRISASEKTVGEVTGKTELEKYDLSKFMFDDFASLFDYCYQNPNPKELERLVFIIADRIEPSNYDKVRQCYQMPLYDKENRRIDITVHYSSQDEAVIKELERLEKRLKKKNKITLPLFFGIIGIEEKRLTLYPLSVF